MKFVLCSKCHTIASPSRQHPAQIATCLCKESAATYTDAGNEFAVSGPCMILALDDKAVENAIDGSRPLPAVSSIPAFVIRRTASTILDLDQ